ncbi:MAG: Fe-S cluster assembly protein IscX [Treponema sp.]|jgi:hypothetical protein|nr:Fe-S cluster assembly protein IscX [Treponema sp.]
MNKAQKRKMNWEDYTEIAEKLNELYPDSPIDALSLSIRMPETFCINDSAYI